MSRDYVSDVNTNWRTTAIKLCDHIPDSKVRRFGLLTGASAGIPSPIYNQIFIFDSPSRRDLEAAVTWMLKRDVPFWVTVPEPLTEEVREHATEIDLVMRDEVTPGMVLTSLDELPSNEVTTDISTVSNTDELDEYVEVAATVFGMSKDKVRQTNPPSLLDDDEMSVFVGRVDGQPVACGRLVRSGDVAGVYAIGVVEEFRRRGIGEAMTWEVLRAGREAGCQVGVLQSSEMAYSLYERMGFETVVNYRHFEPATE